MPGISDGPFIAFKMIGDFATFVDEVRASIIRRRVKVTGVFANPTYEEHADYIARIFNVPVKIVKYVPDAQIWVAFQ